MFPSKKGDMLQHKGSSVKVQSQENDPARQDHIEPQISKQMNWRTCRLQYLNQQGIF